MTDYGSPLFAALRDANRDVWEAYTHHAFVEGLRTGELPRGAFLHYLKQDYLFLIHFARAWSLAAAKTDRIDEMRLAIATANALIDEEMRLHVETCAGEGIDEAALAATEEAPETLAYTRFVTDAGLSGDLLDLLIALAPCVLGYGEIGRRLGAEAASDEYRGWIDTYASPEYQEVCANVAGLIEAVAARRIGGDATASPRWADLAGVFRDATRLERDFWGMGLKG